MRESFITAALLVLLLYVAVIQPMANTMTARGISPTAAAIAGLHGAR